MLWLPQLLRRKTTQNVYLIVLMVPIFTSSDQATTRGNRICIALIGHTPSSLRHRASPFTFNTSLHLFPAKQATKPALRLPCALERLLIKRINSAIDLLAGTSKLLLGLCLCSLVLLARLAAELVELLFGFLRLVLYVFALGNVSNRLADDHGGIRGIVSGKVTYELLRIRADCLVALLACLLEFLVLAGDVASCAAREVCGVIYAQVSMYWLGQGNISDSRSAFFSASLGSPPAL